MWVVEENCLVLKVAYPMSSLPADARVFHQVGRHHKVRHVVAHLLLVAEASALKLPWRELLRVDLHSRHRRYPISLNGPLWVDGLVLHYPYISRGGMLLRLMSIRNDFSFDKGHPRILIPSTGWAEEGAVEAGLVLAHCVEGLVFRYNLQLKQLFDLRWLQILQIKFDFLRFS